MYLMDYSIELGYKYTEKLKELFSEYMDMLIEGDPTFCEYLKIQDYDKEYENIGEKYSMPDGRLYIALYGDIAIGCIALKRIDDKSCEIKRLYVKPEHRSNQIGEKLVDILIEDAKNIGYDMILLDTLPFLKEAIRLYHKKGFYEIESYNDSPMDSSIFMRLDL